MRKNLRLLFATALCMLGVGQTYAQSVPDPLVNLKWGEAGAITDEGTFGGITGFTTYTNSGYNYRRRCPVPTSIYDSVKKTYIGSKDNGWGDSFYVKFNEGDDLANAFLNKFSIEFLYSPQYADAYTANREKASNGNYYIYEGTTNIGVRQWVAGTAGDGSSMVKMLQAITAKIQICVSSLQLPIRIATR